MIKTSHRYDVINGEIEELHAENTHVQYVNNIEQRQKMAGATAMLQAVAGQAGAVHSAQAATDEGDSVKSFVMRVGGKVVSGSFWEATFKIGDYVHAVGSEREGVFHAIAVVKPEERILWMQPHCERGTKAASIRLLKTSSWFILFMLIATALVAYYENMSLWFACLNFIIISVVILFFTVGMSWRDFMKFASEMDAVGEALGWVAPEKIDLFKLTHQARKNGRPELPMGVYYY